MVHLIQLLLVVAVLVVGVAHMEHLVLQVFLAQLQQLAVVEAEAVAHQMADQVEEQEVLMTALKLRDKALLAKETQAVLVVVRRVMKVLVVVEQEQ